MHSDSDLPALNDAIDKSRRWMEAAQKLTGGGVAQTRNRLERDEIVSRYQFGDVGKLVGSSAVLALLACTGIARALDDAPLAVRAASTFDEIYGTATSEKLPR